MAELFARPKPLLSEQIKELQRELGYRRSVYPRWVAAGKLKQEKADFQVAALQAAVDTLKWMQAGSPTKQEPEA